MMQLANLWQAVLFLYTQRHVAAEHSPGMPTEGDLVSLLQQRSEIRRTSDAGQCTCLPWADVYKKHGATCGQALELGHIRSKLKPTEEWRRAVEKNDTELHRMRETMSLRYEFCDAFYEIVHANLCTLQMYLQKASDGGLNSWCYVPEACQALNGGSRVPGTNVSWKACSKSAGDVSFHELSLQDIQAFASKQDVELEHTIGFSYPYINMDWAALEEKDIRSFRELHMPLWIWPQSDHVKHLRSRWIVSPRQIKSLRWEGTWKEECEEGDCL